MIFFEISRDFLTFLEISRNFQKFLEICKVPCQMHLPFQLWLWSYSWIENRQAGSCPKKPNSRLWYLDRLGKHESPPLQVCWNEKKIYMLGIHILIFITKYNNIAFLCALLSQYLIPNSNNWGGSGSALPALSSHWLFFGVHMRSSQNQQWLTDQFHQNTWCLF